MTAKWFLWFYTCEILLVFGTLWWVLRRADRISKKDPRMFWNRPRKTTDMLIRILHSSEPGDITVKFRHHQ